MIPAPTIAITRSSAWRQRRRRWGSRKCARPLVRLATCLCRAIHWIRPSRVSRSRVVFNEAGLLWLMTLYGAYQETVPHASVAGQRHADSTTYSRTPPERPTSHQEATESPSLPSRILPDRVKRARPPVQQPGHADRARRADHGRDVRIGRQIDFLVDTPGGLSSGPEPEEGKARTRHPGLSAIRRLAHQLRRKPAHLTQHVPHVRPAFSVSLFTPDNEVVREWSSSEQTWLTSTGYSAGHAHSGRRDVPTMLQPAGAAGSSDSPRRQRYIRVPCVFLRLDSCSGEDHGTRALNVLRDERVPIPRYDRIS
jgi:hypothetical protein